MLQDIVLGTQVQEQVHGLRGVVTGILVQVETVAEGKIIRHLLEPDRLIDLNSVSDSEIPPVIGETPPIVEKVPPVIEGTDARPKLLKTPPKRTQTAKRRAAKKRISHHVATAEDRGEIRKLAVAQILKSKAPMTTKQVTDILMRENLQNQKFLDQIAANKSTVDHIVGAALRNASSKNPRARFTDEPMIKKVAPGIFQRK